MPIVEVDEKQAKKIKRFLEKESKKLTQKEIKEIKELERKALFLWKAVVKLRAGKKCEVSDCKKTKRLQAHHIESYSTNKGLRYDLENGVSLCTTHHKFGRVSAHKSFCFLYNFLIEERPDSLKHLLIYYDEKKTLGKEDLIGWISYLENKKGLYQRLYDQSKKKGKQK